MVPAPRLLAVSDLHVRYPENRAIVEDLRPGSDGDWLIVAGDVVERIDDVVGTLALLRDRFAAVVWVPGNHELWTRATYRAGVVCTDEHLLAPDPYPDRAAWCAARIAYSRWPPRWSTATCTSRARRGRTACASSRCRWATRASGVPGASPIRCSARFSPPRDRTSTFLSHGRGPALVIVPSDDWAGPADDAPIAALARLHRGTAAGPATLAELADLLGGARSPVLVVGADADDPGTWAALVAPAERLDAPVWQESFAARAGFPQDHPLSTPARSPRPRCAPRTASGGSSRPRRSRRPRPS